MTAYTDLQTRLDAGEVVILDGAMGTELELLGAPVDKSVWCAPALGSHPELVRQAHETYIDAGADVITTYTYTSGRLALENAGYGDKVREWNARAAQVAVQARDNRSGDRSVYVAGSISNYGNWATVCEAELRANFVEVSGVLAENGADLIVVEMTGSKVEQSLLAIEAVAEHGLPVWLSISCAIDRQSGEVMLGIEESQKHSPRATFHGPLAEAVSKFQDAGISALLVMHSDLKAAGPAVKVMRESHHGPVGAYANAGRWEPPNWVFVDQVTPDAYLAEARGWVASGAQIVGGCCGIGPEHIRAVRNGLPARVA